MLRNAVTGSSKNITPNWLSATSNAPPSTALKLTETLEGFRARLSTSAEDLTVEQRQQIIRLVVREVLIGDDDITIPSSTAVASRPPPETAASDR